VLIRGASPGLLVRGSGFLNPRKQPGIKIQGFRWDETAGLVGS
jgi:hypothetical protein